VQQPADVPIAAPTPFSKMDHQTFQQTRTNVTFIPPERVPNERILWSRDIKRGIIHKQVTVQERITNKRIFQYDVGTHKFSQISMGGSFDVVISNPHRDSQSYGGGMYGGGVYTGSRSGTSRTIGCVDVMKDGVRYIRFINVADPQGLKQLINTVRHEVKSAEPSYPSSPQLHTQSAKPSVTINLAGIRAVGNLSLKSQDYLENTPVEQLAEELFNFVEKEFPESNESGIPNSARDAFWASKGIENAFALSPELRLKTERASVIASDKLAKEKAAERSKIEQDLTDECVTWARRHDLTKLAKSDVDDFLHQKEGTMSNYNLIRRNYSLSRDTIYREASLRLLPQTNTGPSTDTDQPSTHYCAQCGAKILLDSKFCIECGARVKQISRTKEELR